MYMLPLALLFTVAFARFSTCYDSRNPKGKYIVIKNDKLAKLLIEKQNFWDRRYTLNKDRNKMSVVGLIFYLCSAFIIVLTLVLMCVPQIPCEPLEIDAAKMYLYAETLNEKIPVIFTMILLCAEFLYFSILLLRYKKEIKQKWIRLLVLVCSSIICLICGAVIAVMLFELLKR